MVCSISPSAFEDTCTASSLEEATAISVISGLSVKGRSALRRPIDRREAEFSSVDILLDGLVVELLTR
jgi:hypothetical protein